MANPNLKQIEKRLPETYYEYKLALAEKDYLNPQLYEAEGQRELEEGEVFINPPLPDSGWRVRVEVIAKNKTTKHWLHIENVRFGIKPCQMLITTNWKRIEAAFRMTFMEKNGYEAGRTPANREETKAALALLLIYAKPKNLSDYSASQIKPMIDLGIQFSYDLYELAKDKVDRSDWKDWSISWRNKYYALLEEVGRKPPTS